MDTYRHNRVEGGGAFICKGYDYSKNRGGCMYVYLPHKTHHYGTVLEFYINPLKKFYS